MNKFKLIFAVVLVLTLGIVFLNNSLFSLPENACYCYDRIMVDMQCESECENRDGCESIHKEGSWCEETTCVSAWINTCVDRYFCTSIQEAYSCADCMDF